MTINLRNTTLGQRSLDPKILHTEYFSVHKMFFLPKGVCVCACGVVKNTQPRMATPIRPSERAQPASANEEQQLDRCPQMEIAPGELSNPLKKHQQHSGKSLRITAQKKERRKFNTACSSPSPQASTARCQEGTPPGERALLGRKRKATRFPSLAGHRTQDRPHFHPTRDQQS